MSSLVGSALDVGYVKVTAYINNETGTQMMLSTRSETSFLICPKSITGCSNSTEGCSRFAESPRFFNETFVGASAQGRYLQDTTLCISDWCSDPYSPAPSNPTSNQSDSIHMEGNSTNGDVENTTKPTNSPTTSPTITLSRPKLGCSTILTGTLKEVSDHGVWGIGPRGIHPQYLTLCFGTKRRAGRFAPSFETDTSPTHWLTFHSDFVLDLTSSRCPLQFLAPDTSWNDEEVDVSLNGSANVSKIVTRIDFSSTYSFLPPRWFATAKESLIAACQSLGCKGYRDYSDGAALMCFRFKQESDENSLPDLEWRIENQVHLLVPPSRYLFNTEDGSRCIGVFESSVTRVAVLGLNMLIGLRLRIDYPGSRLKLDTCVPANLLPFDENQPGTPGGAGDNEGTDLVPIDRGEHDDFNDTPWQNFKAFFLLVIFFGGLALGVLLAIRFKQNSSYFGAKKKKSMFRGASFIRSGFASRKQTFRTVKFVEEYDPPSDEESVASNRDEVNVESIEPPKNVASEDNSGREAELVPLADEQRTDFGEGRGDHNEDRQALLNSS